MGTDTNNMLRAISILLLLVGFSDLLAGERLIEIATPTAETSISSTVTIEAPMSKEHHHGCGEQDGCTHNCHFGHCLFVILTTKKPAGDLGAGKVQSLDQRHRFSLQQKNLFRPPILA